MQGHSPDAVPAHRLRAHLIDLHLRLVDERLHPAGRRRTGLRAEYQRTRQALQAAADRRRP
jgi:hypothetical protein